MERKIANVSILVDGMTCVNCESRIENGLGKTSGIENVRASYANSRVSVTFDANVIGQDAIENIIESLDYQVRKPDGKALRKAAPKPVQRATAQSVPAQKEAAPNANIRQILGVGIILAALFVVFRQFGALSIFNAFPQAEQGMGYGLLLVIGLLTSIHCVAMCGGINLSQCVPHQDIPAGNESGGKGSRLASLKPSILYNAGRVISYTVIGGIVGGIGSVVSFSGWAKGLVAIIAGVFMVIMGLNMLNIFPWLRKFNPRLPRIFARKINAEKQGGRGPLLVGLLNGLMPCGPLQAMQLYALSTGSPLKGALSMLLFSLGTVPLMFGLGALSSLLSKKFTKKMMQVSAVLVVILGVFMFQNGIGLSGLAMPSLSDILGYAGGGKPVAAQTEAKVQAGTQQAGAAAQQESVQMVTSKVTASGYEAITVKAGTPVKWTIKAAAGTINGCNNRLLVPEYKIDKKLAVGDNVIEFTPTKTGTVPFSCWMGMIRSKITVVAGADATGSTAATTVSGIAKTASTAPVTAASTAAGALDGLTAGLGLGLGGCCGVGSAGPSTTGQAAIQPSDIVNGKQQATITVDGYGYSPQILVIQRGLETKITFDVRQATGCSGKAYIPESGLQIDLEKDGSLPAFVAAEDFSISCWMNMLGMNVKVVDDLGKVDLQAIQDEVANSLPAGGGGCCG